MRYNGLFIVLEMAIRRIDDPLIWRHRDALILGSLREDVWYIPLANRIFEHWSFSHFYKPPMPGGYLPLIWPGPRRKGELFYRRALREHRRGRTAAGFVQLGRVAHLLTDMSCPVHVHRTVHQTDPFEWYVEGNKARLLALPVPDVAPARPAELVHDLARTTSRFRDDRTNHHTGRLLRRLGWLRPVTAREAGEQARELIPLAAGYTVALLRTYLRDAAA